ncbi:MAG: YesL family protein [Clostridium butyricum]|nr:YesL family protein [Clostridium butyricum]
MKELTSNENNKIFLLLTKIGDLIILNFLFICTCIPVITVGPAISAMYYVTLKSSKDEESYILKSYFKCFKSNCTQGIYIWIVLVCMTIICLLDYQYYSKVYDNFNLAISFLIGCFMLVVAIIFSYSFVLLAKFNNTIKKIFYNSILIGLGHFPWTVIIIFINSFPVICIFFDIYTILYIIPIYLIIGFSFTAYINSLVFNRVLKRYYI